MVLKDVHVQMFAKSRMIATSSTLSEKICTWVNVMSAMIKYSTQSPRLGRCAA